MSVHLPTKWIRLVLPTLSSTETRLVLALAALGPGTFSLAGALAWARKFGRCPRGRLNSLIQRGVLTVTLSRDLRPGIQVGYSAIKLRETREWVKQRYGAKLSKYLAISGGQLAYLAGLPHRAGTLWLFLSTSPYPTSVRTLARRLGWSRKSVRKALGVLQENKLLDWEWQPDSELHLTAFRLYPPPEVPVPQVAQVPPGMYVRSISPQFSQRLRLARWVKQVLKDMGQVVRLSPLWLQVFGYRSPASTDRFYRKRIEHMPQMVALGELRLPCTTPLPVAEFVSRCEHAPSVRTSGGVLYTAYLVMCVSVGRPPVTRSEFGRALRELGYVKKRSGWAGIAPPATGIGIVAIPMPQGVGVCVPLDSPSGQGWARIREWMTQNGYTILDADPSDETEALADPDGLTDPDDLADPDGLTDLDDLAELEAFWEEDGGEADWEEDDLDDSDGWPADACGNGNEGTEGADEGKEDGPIVSPDELAKLIAEQRARFRLGVPPSAPGPPGHFEGIDW